MPEPQNPILVKMLDRLFAGLMSGPNLNCRPHSSRQRVDWTQFAKLQDVSPVEALRRLLSDKQSTQLVARATAPKKIEKTPEPAEESLAPEEKKLQDDWSAQQSLLTKLRGLAEDARDYVQDTGVHVLHVGFPLLSLPPGTAGALKGQSSGAKRLLAPIAFVSVSLAMRAGPHPAVVIEGLNDGADFLVPNEALFAWLERQTGKKILPEPNGIATSASAENDEPDTESPTPADPHDPWHEINDLVRRVSEVLQLEPRTFVPDELTELRSAPRADDENAKAEIVSAAVLGLFPMNNQGLLRDMQAMVGGDSLDGPVESFIAADVRLDATPDETDRVEVPAGERRQRQFETERMVTVADPCQARAVRLARECRGLVIHGPPGTGKSQTITNIIGDHLARGERVLLVCDKRTALDVVARRLEHLGLGDLCALIHDPQHDQRNLYKQVREQLETLTDTKLNGLANARLPKLDKELRKTHDTLSEAWSLVMDRDPQRGVSFHERMGEWLEAALPSLTAEERPDEPALAVATTDAPAPEKPTKRGRRRRDQAAQPTAEASEPATAEMLEAHDSNVRDILERALQIGFAQQPWRGCAGLSMSQFLSRKMSDIRDDLAEIVEAAVETDETYDEQSPPLLVPACIERTPESTNDATQSLTGFLQQASARRELADRLESCVTNVELKWRQRWAKASSSAIEKTWQRLTETREAVEILRTGSLEPELVLLVRTLPPIREVASQLGDIEAYLSVCDSWRGWFAFGPRARANNVARRYGLAPGPASAQRLRAFLSGLKARMLLAAVLEEFAGKPGETWQPLAKSCALISGLRASLPRAEALEDLRCELTESGLFRADWLHRVFERLCRGESLTADFEQLQDSVSVLEEVLRIQDKLDQLPAPLRKIVGDVLVSATEPDAALNAVRHRVLSDDIADWLKSNAKLQTLDGPRLTNLYRESRRLEQDKREVVRDAILDRWIGRQRERLLALTGSRLNSVGADLRRRLTMRGERALRLRQVIAVGDKIEGGDPLFDLRPVWMASPETVAQIFPREALFDVVIFDEASQCRLEEALPVLTRAKRVVVAGDPKQLPPTRFFESTMITSDDAVVETEQQLFEAQQSEVEDLLAAALSLDIQQSYLDVHYRSRNSDLIEFSNEQFYGSRLQPIPGHPKNRVRFAPITLYRAAGIYDERTNVAEAEQVCRIVADLLRRAEPPSIGIACFNITQRDLILDKLDELAANDTDFAARLLASRHRVGTGAFEGLFVKNLENVQGDERDHIIISTTYGPDKQGRFYRRFGPLGQAGGGRRLNVLVTRAREEVHLVTSIPAELYRSLPPVPAGQQAGGGWLLFSYLAYAERLANVYEEVRAQTSNADGHFAASVFERPSRTPSRFASHLARLLATRHRTGSDVHWGNDGFCVDVALHHPDRPEDRTLGLLCDGTRYQLADDPVEWDVFRTGVLEDQGWQLCRLWTPQFFRDIDSHVRNILSEADHIADTEPDPDSIPVS